MVAPSSPAWASSSAGAAHAASASWAAGRRRSAANCREGLLEHLLLVVGRQVEQLRRAASSLARGRPSFRVRLERAAGRGGGAEAVLGALEDQPLERACAGPTRSITCEAGEAAQPPQPQAHASVGDAHAALLVARRSLRGAGACARRARRSGSRSVLLAGERHGWPAAGSACGTDARPRRRPAGGPPARRGSAPSSTSRARSRAGSRTAWPSRSCMWIGLRSPETAGVAAAQAAVEASTSPTRAAARASSSRRRRASPEPPPRRSIVEVSPRPARRRTRASVTIENVRPCGCCSIGVGRTTSDEPLARRAIGRRCAIRFSRWTSPTAGNGKRPSVISAMCSGKARMCG